MVSAGVVIPIASAVLIFGLRMRELATKRRTMPGSVRERATLGLFLAAGIVLFVGGVTEFLVRGNTLRWPTFVAGWTLALVSFGLRRSAIAALGRFWSLHVEIRDEHEFVRDGPFRWVRHPAYLSMILELVAGGLILNAFWALGVAGLIFIPTLAWRLKLEEAALVEKFGEAYLQYRRHTPALLPLKWPRVP